jgi:LysR family transcriptional regulator for bpeEF and oprC
MDTLLSMRVFTRIVETGSFTRASDTTGSRRRACPRC